MDNSTKKLLEECSVGCKMGIESMEQVQHHVTDAKIAQRLKILFKHRNWKRKFPKYFFAQASREKEPGVWYPHFRG